MQQRAALVRSLVLEPSLMLLDEPFGALDALTREDMNFELQRLWLEHRPTVLLVTHDIGEAILLSSRVLVMSSRPGHFVDDVPVPLARPRTAASRYEPIYLRTFEKLYAALHGGDAARTEAAAVRPRLEAK
jgi:NitT/TauT family transport system ATP-binding protein